MPSQNPALKEYAPLRPLLKASSPRSGAQVPKPSARRSSFMDWSCNHFQGYSEIEAYNIASGTRQVIAEVTQSKDIDAEVTADFITQAVSDHAEMQKLIRHMASALEMCLACEGISWEAEHDADILVRRAERYL